MWVLDDSHSSSLFMERTGVKGGLQTKRRNRKQQGRQGFHTRAAETLRKCFNCTFLYFLDVLKVQLSIFKHQYIIDKLIVIFIIVIVNKQDKGGDNCFVFLVPVLFVAQVFLLPSIAGEAFWPHHRYSNPY